ncbi:MULTISPECIES: hypothetical protein [Metabacillus]|uniref:Uncharacterized protein n=1 Tax=Metabacillus rhizolycopersici TaxID=2875709 RepID=A0ABS7USK7_9BACI|nr:MULTISPECIES: hypothetical protein [Metabacillus]MBZ5751022.1 hypothetical protein [Metabacillus rhizolycopersici]MCM3652487.1 hypothetical protein [Metabacillus litoralis]
MNTFKINDQMRIEKINDHYCLVKGIEESKKSVELCFFSLVDALSYSSERNYL